MFVDVHGVLDPFCCELEPSVGDNVATIVSHNTNVGRPVIRRPASNATISDSLELWVAAPCFFTNQDSGTKVCGPTRAKKHPLVLLLWVVSAANDASTNNINKHLSMLSPTKHTCTW